MSAPASPEADVLAAFDRRTAPLEALAAESVAVALASQAMSRRFHAGGRLLIFGNGGSAADAQHVAVEFVHPVIVGKRALPAMSLASDVATLTGIAKRVGVEDTFAHQVRVLGRPHDIALAVSCDGDCPNVHAALAAARAAGMLTVALTGGDGGVIAREQAAEHCLVIPSVDPQVVKEAHVTAYHLLWELVHVFLENPDELTRPAGAAPEGLASRYPGLFGGGSSADEIMTAVTRSTSEKIAALIALRHDVGVELAGQIASCAGVLARSFAAGGTLYAFGNGGSSTDAQDLASTYLHGAVDQPLPAICLTNDIATTTALTNDVGFDRVFARPLRAFGRPADIATALSTSGGSRNVLAGIDAAKSKGMITVGFAGYGGGPMAELPSLDHLFAVPSSSVHRVQEVQTTIYHVLWETTLRALTNLAEVTKN